MRNFKTILNWDDSKAALELYMCLNDLNIADIAT